MSLLSWFSRKQPQNVPAAESSGGLAQMDATRPLTPGRNGQGRHESVLADNAANRKNERLERRELLYSVVRESMVRAGVLSASYKFKVLSLDQRGRQFLIMMDLSRELAADAGRWGEIEVMVAQAAKARYDILVTAVYWRTSDHVVIGNPKRPALVPAAAPASRTVGKPSARYEPIEADEVAAFKRALSAGATTTAAPSPPAGEAVRSGPRNPQQLTGYEDTEMSEEQDPPETRPSGLSTTQYGDLK